MERKDDFLSSADQLLSFLNPPGATDLYLPTECAVHTQQEFWLALGWLQAACIAWGGDQPQDSIPKLGKDLIR